MRRLVVDEQAVLLVLAGVGEVDAERPRRRRRGRRSATLVLTRTTAPPRVTAMCLSRASRPTSASCWARWTASSSQSCTLTTVSSAPSPTRISTLPACCAEPVWLEHDGGPAVPPGLDHGVAVAAPAVGAPQAHDDRLGQLGLLGDADVHRRGGAVPGGDRGAVGRHEGLPHARVGQRQVEQLHALGGARSRTAPRRRRWAPGVSSDPSRSTGVNRQSSSRPWAREVGDVERGRALGPGLVGDEGRRSRCAAARRVGFF